MTTSKVERSDRRHNRSDDLESPRTLDDPRLAALLGRSLRSLPAVLASSGDGRARSPFQSARAGASEIERSAPAGRPPTPGARWLDPAVWGRANVARGMSERSERIGWGGSWPAAAVSSGWTERGRTLAGEARGRLRGPSPRRVLRRGAEMSRNDRERPGAFWALSFHPFSSENASATTHKPEPRVDTQ